MSSRPLVIGYEERCRSVMGACSAISPTTHSMNTLSLLLTCRFGGNAMYSGIESRRQPSNSGTSNAPHPTLTAGFAH